MNITLFTACMFLEPKRGNRDFNFEIMQFVVTKKLDVLQAKHKLTIFIDTKVKVVQDLVTDIESWRLIVRNIHNKYHCAGL